MWVDDWGNEFETEEDAQNYIIENYLEDENLIEELTYYFTEEELLDWIFANCRKEFENSFKEKIEQAEISWCKGRYDYSYEEEDED